MYQGYRRGAPRSVCPTVWPGVAGSAGSSPESVISVQGVSAGVCPQRRIPRATAARERGSSDRRPPGEPPQRVSRPSSAAYLTSLYEYRSDPRAGSPPVPKNEYLKYKASKLVARLDPERPDNRLLDQIEQFHQQSIEVRNEIIGKLRLVVAMTKRMPQ